jgi:endonuclease/exonuclease/phosphatase family metal-dependent hydrolase
VARREEASAVEGAESLGARLVVDPSRPSTLRVATYNVHKCRGLDGRVRPDRIARVVRELGADVVALQEVLSLQGRPEDDQPRFLARELGLDMHFGEVRSHRGGRYGNLVLSALPLGPGRLYDLSVAGREERGCLRVDVRMADATLLHVFNVHLGTSIAERRQQGPKLLEAVIRTSTDLAGPRVLMGDFNDWRSLFVSLLAAHFRGVDMRAHLGSKRTYPGVLPLLNLDHIYYDERLELARLRLHRSATALVASDHLPLVADFRILPAAGELPARSGAAAPARASRRRVL